jgi:hypothetical protein
VLHIVTINVPVVYMARDVMILMRENPLHGPSEGVGPENRDFFLGHEMAISEASCQLRNISFVLNRQSQLKSGMASRVSTLVHQKYRLSAHDAMPCTDGHFPISCCFVIVGVGGGGG